MTGSRNGVVRVVVGVALTAFIALLAYIFTAFAQDIEANHEMAAENKQQLAIRSFSIARIPAFEESLRAIQLEQARQGVTLAAIAKKVGVE